MHSPMHLAAFLTLLLSTLCSNAGAQTTGTGTFPPTSEDCTGCVPASTPPVILTDGTSTIKLCVGRTWSGQCQYSFKITAGHPFIPSWEVDCFPKRGCQFNLIYTASNDLLPYIRRCTRINGMLDCTHTPPWRPLPDNEVMSTSSWIHDVPCGSSMLHVLGTILPDSPFLTATTWCSDCSF